MFYFYLTDETGKAYEPRNARHFLGIFGFVQGFKLGQEYGLQLAPYILSPSLFILPPQSINQQQSVTVQKAVADENYQEMGPQVQKITPFQNIAIPSIHNKNHSQIENFEKTGFNKPIKRETINKGHIRQAEISTPPPTEPSITDTSTELTEVTNPTTSEQDNSSTTQKANEESTSSIDTHTTSNTTPESLTDFPIDSTESATEIISSETEANTATNATEKEPGIYPEANNPIAGIDKLYITTEFPAITSLTNELTLPLEEKGWSKFSFPLKWFSKSIGGFKPLAGLYYDRFLRKVISSESYTLL